MSQALRIFGICESVAGVFLAWLLLHVMYSLHYAKLYYGEIDHNDANVCRKGLVFPGNQDAVDYWDFVYYSFTIAMCFQTSDVTIIVALYAPSDHLPCDHLILIRLGDSRIAARRVHIERHL